MIHLSAANDVHDNLDDLPLLTDIIRGSENELPILTEIITDTVPIANDESTASQSASSDQSEWLAVVEQKIAVQLDTVFIEKLALLQQQATARAIAEFKAELPILLREVMNKSS